MFAPIRPLPGTTELNAAACADPYNIILHTGFPKIRRPFSTGSKNDFFNPIFRSLTSFRISEFFQLRKIECLFGEALCKMKLSVFYKLPFFILAISQNQKLWANKSFKKSYDWAKKIIIVHCSMSQIHCLCCHLFILSFTDYVMLSSHLVCSIFRREATSLIQITKKNGHVFFGNPCIWMH